MAFPLELDMEIYYYICVAVFVGVNLDLQHLWGIGQCISLNFWTTYSSESMCVGMMAGLLGMWYLLLLLFYLATIIGFWPSKYQFLPPLWQDLYCHLSLDQLSPSSQWVSKQCLGVSLCIASAWSGHICNIVHQRLSNGQSCCGLGQSATGHGRGASVVEVTWADSFWWMQRLLLRELYSPVCSHHHGCTLP